MSKTAYIFPGQGSQKIGMGKSLYDNFSVAKDVYEEVDDALSQKLSAIIFGEDEAELTLTANAQPAIMATSIAALKVMEKETGILLQDTASYVAGHSLGEYSALAAAEAFTLSDTARLLKLRGKSMQEAVPAGLGGMAAIIGLQMEQVEEVATKASASGDICEVANDNSDGQVVLSGSTKGIELAIDIAKEMGAKRALPLPVSAPFHCSLIQSAADAMKQALAETTISTPVVPLVANVTAQETSDVAEISRLLVEQVTGRVRWRESVQYMGDQGVTQMVEVGEGKVLAGLVRRINKAISTSNMGTLADIEKFLANAA